MDRDPSQMALKLVELMILGDTLPKNISNQQMENISTKDILPTLPTRKITDTMLILMTIWLPTLMSQIGKLVLQMVIPALLLSERTKSTLKILNQSIWMAELDLTLCTRTSTTMLKLEQEYICQPNLV
jgi:hypothetical protein